MGVTYRRLEAATSGRSVHGVEPTDSQGPVPRPQCLSPLPRGLWKRRQPPLPLGNASTRPEGSPDHPGSGIPQRVGHLPFDWVGDFVRYLGALGEAQARIAREGSEQ